MLYRKITEGYVVQVYNDAGECIAQRFHAGDGVSYETGEWDPINASNMPLGGSEYYSFDMVQPFGSNAGDEVVEALS